MLALTRVLCGMTVSNAGSLKAMTNVSTEETADICQLQSERLRDGVRTHYEGDGKLAFSDWIERPGDYFSATSREIVKPRRLGRPPKTKT